jgi:hypothetical protein
VIDDDQRTDLAELVELTGFMETLRRIEITEGHRAEDHPGPDDILGFYKGEISGFPVPKGPGKRKQAGK